MIKTVQWRRLLPGALTDSHRVLSALTGFARTGKPKRFNQLVVADSLGAVYTLFRSPRDVSNASR